MELVLLRHGQSVWNEEGRFTGWTDVDLSPGGVEEARLAGRRLREGGYQFDVVFTSVLKRGIRTSWVVMDDMDLMWIPLHCSWRLNERHYGALQGLSKGETEAQFGESQVHAWRREFETRPPPLSPVDPRHPRFDPRYRGLREDQLPATESLQDTLRRVQPFWHETILPRIRAGDRVLISAHGNSLRALVKHLDNISDEDIADVNIPTGIPLVYELEGERAMRHRYLASEGELAEAMERASRVR